MGDSILDKLSFLDTENGMELCGGEEEFYVDVLLTYLEDTKLDKLIGFFDAGDMENYKVTIHGLKSSSRSIGADKLADKAMELEAACKEGRLDYVRENHGYVMDMYKDLLDKLTEILPDSVD